MDTPIQSARIQFLNDLPLRKGSYVLYWMQQSQRATENHALEYAVAKANDLGLGVVVVFGLTQSYPEANLRHFTFMLEGLQETQATLAERGVKMVVRLGSPPDVALELEQKASLIVCDRGYLRHQRTWRNQVARAAGCRVVQVESDAVVPVEIASQKADYAARTFRPKVQGHLYEYLIPVPHCLGKHATLNMHFGGLDLASVDPVLSKITTDRKVTPVSGFFKGGTSQAKLRLERFVEKGLNHYVANRNQPQTDDISHMSPYLHFGQISPVYIALAIKSLGNRLAEAQAAYLEELIVRRELAVNFVYYTPNYDTISCLTPWAQKTLQEHAGDPREYVYSRDELEAAQTHDPYWNAAMREMKFSGFMHNYMRMYWGKKILEWSQSPEIAYENLLAINNKFFLDGRDANSYAGVAWVFGIHDRAWFERPIFGKVRIMTASGLERKCKIGDYVDKVDALQHANSASQIP